VPEGGGRDESAVILADEASDGTPEASSSESSGESASEEGAPGGRSAREASERRATGAGAAADTAPRGVTPGERIGLFGGTFDPVHFGHLRPALELAESYALERLCLLPAHRPAHRGPTGASSAERIAMLERAVADVPQLAVDTREARRDGPSYTVETLAELRAERPRATLLFFLGRDAFAGFESWHRPDDILELANLVIVERPGEPLPASAERLIERQRARCGTRVRDGAGGVIERADVTQLAISATAIRRHVAAGGDPRFLLPESVRAYIGERGLYRASAPLSSKERRR